MTKTKTKPVQASVATYEETDAKLITYRNLYEQAMDLKHQMDALKLEIEAACKENPDWFDGSYTKHFSNTYIKQKSSSVINMPADMAHVNDKKLIKFCRAYPRAVKFELVKENIKGIDVESWGIEIETKRKIDIDW